MEKIPQSLKTLNRLMDKAGITDNFPVRMPSIDAISKMLTEYGIPHEVDTTVNIVEYQSKGNRYVNSRHKGKEGKSLDIPIEESEYKAVGTACISMDTSDSYYSVNSSQYAYHIVQLLKVRGKIK